MHENSVDAICANPQSENEFATGSHDHTIKMWDAPKYGVKSTIKGHEKGVWALSYDNTGKRLISASPDQTSKIWDVKSGKCMDTLRGHTHFVSLKKIFEILLLTFHLVLQSSLFPRRNSRSNSWCRLLNELLGFEKFKNTCLHQ